MSEFSDYLGVAEELAKTSGHVMREHFAKEEHQQELKADNTPVTEADKQINEAVIKVITHAFPGHGVLGEEASCEGDGEYVWVCDPIDGTRPFTYGIPISTFNLALTQNGEPLVAVQYDPFMDRLYSAARGLGARLNGQKIQTTGEFSGKVPVNLEVYTNRPSVFKDPRIETKIKEALVGDEWYLMKMGSVGYSLGLVACGRYGAAVFSGGGPYEAATGSLLISEAGGRFTNIFGAVDERLDQPTAGLIAAHPSIHQKLVEAIAPVLKEYGQLHENIGD